MRDEDDAPRWQGSPDDPIFRQEDVERCTTGSPGDYGRFIHAAIQEQSERDALVREGQVHKWLRDNWPWYVRWAIGYPRAIHVLDRLGLVTMPVFVMSHIVGDSQLLKDSTSSSWTFQVYGYDVRVYARAFAVVPGDERVDIPLTPGMFDGHAVLILDPGPMAEAINEWEASGGSV